MRVLLVTATAALGTLVVWFVGAGASATASEITADAADLLGPPAGSPDDAEDEAPGPIAAAVNGLDGAAAVDGATPGKVAPAVPGPATSAPAPSASTVRTVIAEPATPSDRGSAPVESIPDQPSPAEPSPAEPSPAEPSSAEPSPVEQTGDELVGRPVEHVLHQAQPALEPVARTGGAVGDVVGNDAVGNGAVSDDPVSAALPEIRGHDVAGLLGPLWSEEGAVLPPPDANLPPSGEKADPAAAPARVDTASHGSLPGPLRSDQRSANVFPTGEIPEDSRDARGTPTSPDAPVVDAPAAHPVTGQNAVGAVVDGGNHAGFVVGWYPVTPPADGSLLGKRIPDEDRIRSGASAPQPGTTPD